MGHAVVSVVTKRTADDANGCNIDGEDYYVTRLFSLACDQTIKVGLVAQAPIGRGGARYFANISLENRIVANIRIGE